MSTVNASGLQRRHVVAGLALIGFTPLASPQLTNVSQAINMSGRQRMLSARIAKAYVQLGRAVEPGQSSKLLTESVSQFDLALTQLRVFSRTGDARETLGKLSEQWQPFKELAIGSEPSKERAKQVLERADGLAALASTVTLQFEQEAGRPTAKLTNVCGRQRMLTQQIATLGFSKNWLFAATQVQPMIAKRQQEYLDAVALLQAAKENTPEIRRQLTEAGSMWVFFNTALSSQTDRVRTLEDLGTASELILKLYDDLTKLYAALA